MTVSAAGLRQALDQLADLRSAPVTVEEALERVVATADALFGVDGTALMLVDRDQALRNLAVSDARAAPAGAAPGRARGGPVRRRLRGQAAGRGRRPGQRRPLAGVRAGRRQGGLLAVLASPIPYSDHAVGVVAVFAGEPHPWAEGEREAIVAFTELVALLVLNAMEASERGRLAGELQVALDSRVVIEQAKGVLVGRHGLTTRQAFDRLRRQARDQRRPLSEVARAVVSAAEHR